VNARQPIYTEATECQACYKCIRHCPVKAIKVEGGYASVEPDRCIVCGLCVEACPNGAKKVRDDLRRVEALLRSGRRVVVSLAPSFVSEFAGGGAAQIPAALRRLGFWAVSETALGAQEVSARCREMLATGTARVLISSACPVAVDYIRKYRPDASGLLTPLLSPMLAHARLLRSGLGEDIAVVFIGPCIAKKREADAHPELVDAALTFEDLRRWLERDGIDPAKLDAAEAEFVPRRATTGAFYPIEGGMLRGVRGGAPAVLMASSGLRGVERALDGIEDMTPDKPVFLELLACEGGCVNGPKAASSGGTVRRHFRVLRYATAGEDEDAPAGPPIGTTYTPEPPPGPAFREPQIREVLRAVGKNSAADELNCGGCGYDSCRGFAAAFLAGRAERRMCVTYMRKLAEKKTHVLMQMMPSAVVLTDENLRILECNPSFARFFAPPGSDAEPRALENRRLDELVPFYNLFTSVLETGEDVPGRDIRFRGRVFHVTVFSVERHSVVGGIFRDETQPAVQKEQIIERARQVLQNNLRTAQQIAYLIGENAADSEIAVKAIVDSFSPETVDEDGAPE
jgi:iron only hydrogenase large subunit-like protein